MAVLKLNFVNSYIDSRGSIRHTFRRKGHERVTLRGQPGTAEFMAHYDELRKLTDPDAETVDRDAPGSVDSVIKNYLKDEMFTDLAKATQCMRAAILKRFRNSVTPGGRRFGDNMIATLQTEKGKTRLKEEITKQSTPAARKNYLKALRGLMAYATGVKSLGLTDDPTDGIKIKPAKKKSGGHLTWHSEQILQYRETHALGTTARLALELALNIAARRHDAHVIGRPHLKSGRLVWKPHKTLHTSGKQLSVKASQEFLAALEAMPKSDALTFLTTDYGRPFKSAAALGNKFADWCRVAGLKPLMCDDGRVRSHRLHGLRKAALTKLAHDGCTGPELLAVSGHSSLQQVEPYIQEANQARLADSAMAKSARKSRKTKARTSL